MENPSYTDVIDSGSAPSLAAVARSSDEVVDDGIFGLDERDTPLLPTRTPTFKEFGEQIKALTQENFQLKVRIYLHETKYKKGGLGSGPDTAAAQAATTELTREFHALRQEIETYRRKLLESENRFRSQETELQNCAAREEHLLNRNQDLAEQLLVLDREVTLARLNQRTESDDIGKCFNSFKVDGDEEKFEFAFPKPSVLITEDQQVRELISQIREQSRVIEDISVRNEDLKLEQTELCRQHQDLSLQNIDLHHENRELVRKNSDLFNANERLTEEVSNLTAEVKRTKEIIAQLEERTAGKNELLMQQDCELDKQRKKHCQMVESLKEIGFKYVKLEEVNTDLRKQLETLRLESGNQMTSLDRITQLESEANAKMHQMNEKLDSVKQIANLFQSRVTELVGFLEGLLELESRGIPNIDRVLRSHRETIDSSLKQSQMLSDVLGQLLADELPTADIQRQLIDLTAFNAATLASIQFSLGAYELQSPRARSRPTSATVSIQCDRTKEAPTSTASATRINLMTHEKIRLEATRERLMKEKGELYAKVATLEANLSAMKQLSSPLIMDDLKRKLERREKTIRVLERDVHARDLTLVDLHKERNELFEKLEMAESTLRTLHDNHGKLVSELKGIQSDYPLKENHDGFIRISKSDEALRPSESSPDLGIESGHDLPASCENVLRVSNQGKANNMDDLRVLNRDLAAKLKHTRNALEKTLEKLDKTTKEKEQVEKAICRQLHKTHNILRTAKKNLESPSEVDFDCSLPVTRN